MSAVLDLAHRVRELEVDRRGVYRVAAEDDQQVHLAGVHIGDQIGERLELVDRFGLRRLRVDDGLTGVAERLVHRVRERVDDWRLAVACDHERAATMRLQVLRDASDPFPQRLGAHVRLAEGAVRHDFAGRLGSLRLSVDVRARFRHADCRRDQPREGLDDAGTHRQPMVRPRAG